MIKKPVCHQQKQTDLKKLQKFIKNVFLTDHSPALASVSVVSQYAIF